jgi:hypothetical protein
MMKKSLFLIAVLFSVSGFADMLVLDNLTAQKSKMVIQWANTAREIEDANQALVYGTSLNSSTMQPLTQAGKIKLTIPQKAEYFRVLAWSKEGAEPDLHTNWVQIVPNKTYTLKPDHLVPCVLMAGMGC